MIYSMTGFGKSIVDCNNKKITTEVKSLNSKQFDINVHIPNTYKEIELDIRSIAAKKLSRGKIDLSISVVSDLPNEDFSINIEIARKYYDELRKMETCLCLDKCTDYLPILTRLPDVINTTELEITEEELSAVISCVNKAIENLKTYRADEGKVLEQDFIKRVNLIRSYLTLIEPFEKNRIEILKARIINDLSNLHIDYDKNRFEQEIIYYVEKLDITEEKVRLANHCDYFMKTLDSDESQGRQLGFIVQEMGREINTIGSKANNADIQQIVVKMKDELEKIREQLANIL